MIETSIFELACHVRPGPDAILLITIGDMTYEFNLLPTINWVPSSDSNGAHTVLIELDWINSRSGLFEFSISAEHNDILICGYEIRKGRFRIATQPIWNVIDWQPYDISGHQGDDAEYQGNGSLQILKGQTVKFGGEITIFAKR